MKCPKCGYNSFESYDTCKKCSADLTEFKQIHKLTALVLPPSLRASMATEFEDDQGENDNQSDGGADMFTFDLPTDHHTSEVAEPAASTNPFSFNETAAAPAVDFSFDLPPASAENDPFASLLESTTQKEDTVAAPAAQPGQAEANGFELNNFSWDDAPESEQPESNNSPGETNKQTADDDFNSLFGDLGIGEKK